MKQHRALTIVLALIAILGFAFPASAQETNREACKKKAEETLESLDQWVGEYNVQLEQAEPMQKGKYEEWIRELKKLKTLVQNAQEKLENKEKCSSADCVSDQCGLIDIADQQVTQLVEETQEQIGASSRFGDETGRQVATDEDLLGDDTILNNYNSDDAAPPTYTDQSRTSDNQSGGRIGDSPLGYDDTSSDDTLPPSDPLPAEDDTPVGSPQ